MISEKKSIVHFNWRLLFILSTSAMVLGITRDGISALFPFIQAEFNLTRTQIGFYSTFVFFSATLVAVFTGRVVDLLGAKLSMIIGVVSVGFAILMISFAPTFSFILAIGFFNGLGFSIIAPANSKGVMESFPVPRRATAMGFVQSAIGVGSFFAAFILPSLAEFSNWQKSLLLPALFSFCAAFFIYKYYQPAATGLGKSENVRSFPRRSDGLLSVLLSLLRDRYNLLLCLQGLIFGAAFAATNTYFTLYLVQDHALSRTVAGLGFSFLHIGAILGRFGWAFVGDHFFGGDRRKGLFVICLSITCMSLIFGLLPAGSSISLVLLFFLAFLLGFSALGFFGLYITAVCERPAEENIGTATGLAMIFLRCGLMVSPPVFGYVADLRSTYNVSWLLLGFVVFISATSMYFLMGRHGSR